jgi:hypothetical protein
MLDQVKVRPIQFDEREKWQAIMSKYHYLGHAHPFGNTIYYVAEIENRWLALIGFSACALKCKPRDSWIGWSQAIQFGRLHLIANNTRFLIVSEDPVKNLASKVLSLCLKRISKDWRERFGYPIVMVETFVDPDRFQGTCYKASNWKLLGKTKGYRKHRGGYLQNDHSKLIFVIELHKKAKEILSSLSISSHYLRKKPMIALNTSQTISLYRHLLKIKDPRGKYGKRHKKTTILAIAIGAILGGADSYLAIWDWAKNLTQSLRKKIGCRLEEGEGVIPSESTIRRFLQKLDPESVDLHLSGWIMEHIGKPKAIAFDGKTVRGSKDDSKEAIHLLSAFIHDQAVTIAQKKSMPRPTKSQS